MAQLSGVVAVLSVDGLTVIDVRDLGPRPVDVKPGRVLPLVESKPVLTAGQDYGVPTFTIAAEKVTRTWPVVTIEYASLDQAALNAALMEQGSVVRALGLVMFAEINKLRVAGGSAAYTMPQFLAALKAQMR